jgi:uncharacterized protein (TIGR01777 family)
MRLLITGATGFIGRALVPRLQRDGHSVVAWARSEQRARNLLGADVETVSSETPFDSLVATLQRCDAVVNLAGEPLMGGRWTAGRRTVLEASRVGVTNLLVRAIGAADPRPRVLVSASAVGIYGDRGDEVLTEDSAPGRDFLANLCRRWEQTARGAEAHGLRVVYLRTAVVLGQAGGALAQMLPLFEMGVGGPIGAGRQFMPWIHLFDLVEIIAVALVDGRFRGHVNGVAPEPATSRDFARALGRALHRPAVLPAPAVALKSIFGQAATVLLASQRVMSRVLTTNHFVFQFPTLTSALQNIVDGAAITIEPCRTPSSEAEGAAYQLRTTMVLASPVEQTFAFFSRAENLGLITPARMKFSIDGTVPPLAAGAAISYRLRVGSFPLKWRSRITAWEPGRRFVDVQEIGPYRVWRHEHLFEANGAGTLMTDTVWYTPPVGWLGRLANKLVVAPMLRRIFRYRAGVVRLRFG